MGSANVWFAPLNNESEGLDSEFPKMDGFAESAFDSGFPNIEVEFEVSFPNMEVEFELSFPNMEVVGPLFNTEAFESFPKMEFPALELPPKIEEDC